MQKIVAVLVVFLGCSANSFAQQCDYDAIEGLEYRVAPTHSKYVKNDFDAFPDKLLWQQGGLENYVSLISSPFKVTSTNSVTASSVAYKGFLSDHRFKDLEVDTKAYNTDAYYNVEVTTSDCQKFYYNPSHKDLRRLQNDFIRIDGQPITTKNYFDFLGSSIVRKQVKTTSKYDKFEKKYLVKTDYFKDYLIRGDFDKNKNKFSFIQIYLHTRSLTKSPWSTEISSWRNIVLAKDTDANSHEVMIISQEADCDVKNIDYGCTLKEEIAVDVSEQFLRKNKDGFELKLIGDGPMEQKISGDVVTSFLKEVDRLKSSKQ